MARTELPDPSVIVDRLFRAGLLTSQNIVDGHLRVSDISRRNTNFQVESEVGPSYLVKQGIGGDRVATIAGEAAVYAALQGNSSAQAGSPAHDAWQEVASFLPPYYSFDHDANMLILGLVPDAETLAEHHTRTGKFSAQLARSVGRALALLHTTRPHDNPALYSALACAPYSAEPHWILSMPRPYLRRLADASAANIQTVKIVQRFPEFCKLLDTLKEEWLSLEDSPPTQGSEQPSNAYAPIHCDIKWNNILVHKRPAARRSPAVKVVDWELARLGDPCWDTGSFFGEYLTYWLLSIPVTGQEPPERFVSLARYPVEAMRPAMRAFWTSYLRHAGLLADPAEANVRLLRSVRYAAARLLQTAYEQGQTSSTLTGNIVVLLQVAFNILQRPAEAAYTLMGILPLQSHRHELWRATSEAG
ncbi:MAG: phosphotransferase [Chloroflexota bacterium]